MHIGIDVFRSFLRGRHINRSKNSLLYPASKENTIAYYPFHYFHNHIAFHHKDRETWFGLIMNVPRQTLRLNEGGNVDILNVKCPPEKCTRISYDRRTCSGLLYKQIPLDQYHSGWLRFRCPHRKSYRRQFQTDALEIFFPCHEASDRLEVAVSEHSVDYLMATLKPPRINVNDQK